MPTIGSLVNLPVIIYDEEGKCITKAIITRHDARHMAIDITDMLGDVKPGTRLDLLIIHTGGASEFSAVAKSIKNGQREIGLYNERPREARAATRHKLYAPAEIKTILRDSSQEKLGTPIDVVVDNISSSGALVMTSVVQFQIGDTLEIHMKIKETDAVLFGTVVRMQENENKSISYGCKFVFVK